MIEVEGLRRASLARLRERYREFDRKADRIIASTCSERLPGVCRRSPKEISLSVPGSERKRLPTMPTCGSSHRAVSLS